MQTLKIKPAVPGAIVRDPVTRRPLPAGGAEVPDNIHWRQRLRDRDVVEVDVVEVERADTPALPLAPVAPLTTR